MKLRIAIGSLQSKERIGLLFLTLWVLWITPQALADTLIYDSSGRIVYKTIEEKEIVYPAPLFQPEKVRDGKYLELDGADDYATAFFPKLVDIFEDDSTIESWIYLRSLQAPTAPDRASLTTVVEALPKMGIVIVNSPAMPNLGIPRFIALAAVIENMKGEYRVVGDRELHVPLKQWIHVAVGYDVKRDDIFLSVDGVLRKVHVPIKLGKIKRHFTVGFTQDIDQGVDAHFDGLLDDIRVSDVVRYRFGFNPLQALQKDANTLAIWSFDEAHINSTVFKDAVEGIPLIINGKSAPVFPRGKRITTWGTIKRRKG